MTDTIHYSDRLDSHLLMTARSLVDAADQALVDELNRVRLDEDQSYADLGRQIGIDPGALHKILNGKAEPYDRTIAKVRRFLEKRRPQKRRSA